MPKPKIQPKVETASKSKPLSKQKSAKDNVSVKAKVAAKDKVSAKGKVAAKGGAKQTKAARGSEVQLKDGKFKKVSDADAQESMRLICERYPAAECELTFKNDFELLTAVILSAQTTDANVNKATPGLFKKFPTAQALANGNPDEVRECVKSTGFFNAKAKNIQACAKALVDNFGGKVPTEIEDLVTLPGVGRKTANVLLGVIHDIPGWTVDTHVQRLVKRLGLTDEPDPTKIEFFLQKLFPGQPWHQYSITLIWHGRRCCFARNPDCAACPVNHLCPSSLVSPE